MKAAKKFKVTYLEMQYHIRTHIKRKFYVAYIMCYEYYLSPTNKCFHLCAQKLSSSILIDAIGKIAGLVVLVV